MKPRDTQSTLFPEELPSRREGSRMPIDPSKVTPLEASRLMQLPLDPNTLSQLPVDTSRLMRMPVDYSGLMRLPIDPNSEVEKEFFGKKLMLDPEQFEDHHRDEAQARGETPPHDETDGDPSLAPSRPVWRRPAVMFGGLGVIVVGGLIAVLSLRSPAAPPAAAADPPPAASEPSSQPQPRGAHATAPRTHQARGQTSRGSRH